MTKADLSAKWGKYCNTNKLVDDMMQLLTANGHSNSEHGVCTVLDEYFTKKEPLIKMFITSNHYIGGMRIAVQKGFERDIDVNAVWSFCNRFSDAIGAEKLLLCYKDEDGNQLTDYLKTGVKKTSLLEVNPAKISETKSKIKRFDLNCGATVGSYNKYEQFLWYMGYFRDRPTTSICESLTGKTVELKKGTKMSRAFNKVCAHYGIDKAKDYNRLFAQYADLVTSSVRNLYFVISLNPLDYLTMSNGNSWTSCHRIKGANGYGAMCASGCMSYMLDDVSIITYVVESLDEPMHNIGKIYRQMYYYDDNFFVQSRLYPQGNDGATNLYEKFRGMVQEEFCELLNLDSDEWTYEPGPSKVQEFSTNVGHHYNDAGSNRQCGIFYPKEKKSKITARNRMVIGHESLCCKCGKPHTHRGRLTHESC